MKELNRKKDIVCLILSYPPMNTTNKERHKNWVQDVLKINRSVWQVVENFSSQRKMSVLELYSEITALLEHSLDDIEAYVPPMTIKKMYEKILEVDLSFLAVDVEQLYSESTSQEVKMNAEPKRHDEKLHNLAVDFAIRQILQDIENPEVLRIRISGRDGRRVTSALKYLPQIQKMFSIIIQVDASSRLNIRAIEENIAAHLGFSTWEGCRLLLENTSFLIFLDDIHEGIDLYEVGSIWLNSKNIQKIVCTTTYEEVYRRMAVDLEIRLEDHLLSWELFCLNAGKIVHSKGFQHTATDVVGKCYGHLLAVVLMARALKKVSGAIIWDSASCILGLSHRVDKMKDRVLCNALTFVLGHLGSAKECVKYSAFHLGREGINKIHLIMEWIGLALVSTFDEGEKIVQDLINAFLFEGSQDGCSVRMQDEIREVLVDMFRLEINTHFLLLGGRELSKAPNEEAWKEASEIHLMNNKLSELPKSPNCPHLYTLFLQKNSRLRVIPPLFFLHMPMLQILDLSYTKIRSLPQSLFGLVQLQRLFLRGCELFMELPSEIGKLSNLKVLDLEGTELIRLPVDVGKLTNLTCLKLSFFGDDNKRKVNQSNIIIPQNVISSLFQLEELIINVNPDNEPWNANVNDIVKEVCNLDRLQALQLYLPKVSLLNELWDASSSINLSGMRFKFTVGSHLKRIISRLPFEAALKFDEQERCLKFVKGEGVPTEIEGVLQHASALFLDRHLTATSLTEFGIENMRNLKFCILGECDEIQTVVDAGDEYFVLGSLEYLDLHYMKNLRSIWKGPFRLGSLSCLKCLVLYACPQLTTIFTLDVTFNLRCLEELVVEDCPKIESILMTRDPNGIESMLWTRYLFPKLKRISLHYMPKLVSISNGLCISPVLEWMSLYDCPSLETLYPEEVHSNDLKVIVGEAEWWRELKWNVSESFEPPNLDAIFVPIEWFKDLTTQLAGINVQHQAMKQENRAFSTVRLFSHSSFSSFYVSHASYYTFEPLTKAK